MGGQINYATTHVIQRDKSTLQAIPIPNEGFPETYLSIETGAILHQLYVSANAAQLESKQYKYSVNPRLKRVLKDRTAAIKQFDINCDGYKEISKSGALYCLYEGVLTRYFLESSFKQSAITFSGVVAQISQVDSSRWLIVENFRNGSTLSLYELKHNKLQRIKQIAFNEQCIARAKMLNEHFFLAVGGKLKQPMFEFGQCSADMPLTYFMVASDSENGESAIAIQSLELNIDYPTLYLPHYRVSGVANHHSKYRYSIADKGKKLVDIENGFSEIKTEAPFLVSFHPSKDEKLVTFGKPNDDGSLNVRLERRVASNDKVIEVLATADNSNINQPTMFRHGYSADGALLWWSELKGNAQINWQGNPAITENLPQQLAIPLDQLYFSTNGLYLLVAGSNTHGAHQIFDLRTGELVFDRTQLTGWMQNNTGIAFHPQLELLIFDGKVYSLNQATALPDINYPDKVKLLDFHPQLPWASGICAENRVCIVDVLAGEVVFELDFGEIRGSISKIPSRVRFTRSGEQLSYLVGDRTFVVQNLEVEGFDSYRQCYAQAKWCYSGQ